MTTDQLMTIAYRASAEHAHLSTLAKGVQYSVQPAENYLRIQHENGGIFLAPINGQHSINSFSLRFTELLNPPNGHNAQPDQNVLFRPISYADHTFHGSYLLGLIAWWLRRDGNWDTMNSGARRIWLFHRALEAENGGWQ